MPTTQMLVNYVPGDECRVALVEDGELQEFNAERMSAVSRVGNIYVGKVTNIEAGIQAAFVDFGIGENGFLHVSDLHPQYFPGEDDQTTERVGKKTPRRERPPIQRCLSRGQEIIVQVLKEGVGTKGPSLTSYLSIPGRYLVMMPQMDRVGVSRKVEDDDIRRDMRKILDTLELPEGFGFILRTAGLERTKTELKRDLAYLQRLWKDMERRRAKGKRPRLLYSESDLLLRSLRDQLTADVDQVVVDNEFALERASKFMKIVAPRASTKLMHYGGHSPIFHAFGVEAQIRLMHAREVPLPSGGRLVIDETEALVSIDVNSGKMRNMRDTEATAYKANLEAADVICRQLRLRDLGGLVICDLIDMRDSKHRRAVEQRFRERLRRDRARSTILPISNFGILEMTRQRMRASHESQHFAECPTCHGRGLVQRPGSVAADALRELASLLDMQRVEKVELVVGPRVASELLSTRRATMNRIERLSDKKVEVRVSETLPPDRVAFYAYDPGGADLEIDGLKPSHPKPATTAWVSEEDVEDWAIDPEEEAQQEEEFIEELVPHPVELDADEEEDKPRKKRRRRRRRRRSGSGEDEQGSSESSASDGDSSSDAGPESTGQEKSQETNASSDESGSETSSDGESSSETSDEGGEKKKRRRRRRRRRRGGGGDGGGESSSEGRGSDESVTEGAPTDTPSDELSAGTTASESDDSVDVATEGESTEEAPKKKRRRRRSRKKSAKVEGATEQGGEGRADGSEDDSAEGTSDTPVEAASAETVEATADEAVSNQAESSKASSDEAAPIAEDESSDESAEDVESRVEVKKKTKKKAAKKASKKKATAKKASKKTTKKASKKTSKKKVSAKVDESSNGDAPKPRSLYGASRRTLKPSERARISRD